jgi:ABC-2 type transport system permease protein
MFPLWIMIVIFVPQWTGGNGGAPRDHVYTVIDRTGGAYAAALDCLPRQMAQKRWLAGAQHYAAAYTDAAKFAELEAPFFERHPVIAPYPGAPANLACGPVLDTDAIARALQAARKPGAPAFKDAPPDAGSLTPILPPAYLAAAPPQSFAGAVRRALAQETVPGFDTAAPLDTVIVIPAGFGKTPDAAAEIWSNQPDPDFKGVMNDALTRALQMKALHAIAPQIGDALDLSARLEPHDPDRQGARRTTIDSIVPIALAIILFVVSVMNASVLLQGVVEEKSTRMIEVLLSCATPREITTGKLIGVIAVALTTLLIWGLALFALMALASHDTVALVFASLRAAASLETLPLLLVFFLCGLLIYGSLFLAIGSMANSLADAQSLLGPSMLILMLPNLMISGIIRDPNGPLASALSWVPIYTPFFMMLRIASHPPAYQLWGGLALAVATAALLIWWTGRVFARHVLTTERPPTLGALLGGLLGRRA